MCCNRNSIIPWENKCSQWAHGELTVSTVVTAPGPNDHGSVTARRGHGEVTAQSRLGHSSVTARSQLSHGEVTAQSRHLQYDHGSVPARSQLNHGPGHGSVTTGCDHFGHRELPMSSRWAHRELTVSSHGGHFFLMGWYWCDRKISTGHKLFPSGISVWWFRRCAVYTFPLA